MRQAGHGARVGVVGQLLALAHPRHLQRLAELLEFGHELGVGDVQGGVAADVAQLGIEAQVVVVVGGLAIASSAHLLQQSSPTEEHTLSKYSLTPSHVHPAPPYSSQSSKVPLLPRTQV